MISSQVSQVIKRFPYLHLTEKVNGDTLLKGVLAFEGDYHGEVIADEFDVELHIPSTYPEDLPLVREIGYRIPRNFHVNLDDNTLCLAAPIAIKMHFSKDKTLLGFIGNLAIPFFYNFLYQQKHGSLILGELSHGTEGILEFYREYFHLTNDAAIIEFLRILAHHAYQGYSDCPCNSGEKLRVCHGRKVLRCGFLQSAQEYQKEYHAILNWVRKKKLELL